MKKEYLFGIGGILLGAIVAGLVTYTVFAKEANVKQMPMMSSSNATHTMPDGSQMGNMDEMTMDDMTESLRGKTGDAFDEEFINQMIIHHEGAIDMAELAKKNAKHQEIIDLSDEIIKAQSTEIDQMNTWKDSWGY